MKTKKTKETIEKKRSQKLKEVEFSCKIKHDRKKRELLAKAESDYKRQLEKFDKKLSAYINKKKTEYDRRCKNEIRALEGKPQREYKTKKKTFNIIQFSMELLQENSRLRDTDADGRGFCISHAIQKVFEWSELAGGHRYSRSIRRICLEPINVNAQCHGCNFTTGPRGNKEASDRTNAIYDENLDKKYGEGTSERLRQQKESYFKNTNGTHMVFTEKDLVKMIDENEWRWGQKNFYKPAKKWRKIWEENKCSFTINLK